MNTNKIIGYHGTSKKDAVQIVGTQEFNDSSKENEWLGTGVYFFAHKESAQWWLKRSKFKNQATRILAASLEYFDNQMFDLDDPGKMDALRSTIARVVERANDEGESLSIDFTDCMLSEKWCFACNTLRDYFPEVGIIAYTFYDGPPGVYTGFRTNRRQICVSDHSIIKCVEECEAV